MDSGIVRRRIANIIRKEWETTLYNVNSGLFITLVPLLITGQALLYIYLIIRYAGTDALMSSVLRLGVEKLELLIPALPGLSPVEKLQLLFYLQYPIYLLLVPMMIANSFATFSVVEEKQTRTLEPLLATPVRTWELLLGKSLAGAIPAVIMSWICAALFLLGVKWIGPPHLFKYVLSSSWLISLVLLVPLITVLSFMLGVVASSRAGDPKSAQNMAIIIVLPVLALIAVQLIGLAVFTPMTLLVLATAIAALDVLILWIAVRLFQRESIVVTWR